MMSNWLRTLFSPKTRQLTDGRRSKLRAPSSFRPNLVHLEDRLAPAVVGNLMQIGNYLYYSGTSANNVVSISGTNAAFTISDSAGTITSTAPGFASGSSSTTGSLAGITSIVINTGSGFDSVTVPAGGLTMTPSIQVTADLIDVEGALKSGAITFLPKANGSIVLDGSLDSTANASAGTILMYGPVSLGAGQHAINTSGTAADGDVDFYSTITGSGGLDVNVGGFTAPESSTGNFLALKSINIGGSLNIGNSTDAADGNVIAGANAISLESTVTVTGAINLLAENSINLFGNVNSNSQVFAWANLDDTGANSFTQYAGNITTTSSAQGATATIEIDVNDTGNGMGNATINELIAGPGSRVQVNTQSNADGGRIYDGNGTGVVNIQAGEADVYAGNYGANLDISAPNLNAQVLGAGDLIIRDTIGSALTVSNATTSNGNVSITNNGSITLESTPTSFYGAAGYLKNFTLTTTGGGNVSIQSAVTDVSGKIIINSSGNITDAGIIENFIPAPEGGSLSAPTVNLTAVTGIGTLGAPIDLIGNTTVNASTTGGDILLADTGNLTIASASAPGNIVLTLGGNLTVVSGGTVTAGGSLTVTAPNVNSTETIIGTVNATGAISIGGSTTGTFSLTETGAVTGSTVTVTGATQAANAINLNGSVKATAGNITVSTTTGGTSSSSVSILGQMSATGTTQITGSTVASVGDNFVIAPSAFSTFTFTFGAGANTLFIDTPVANILSSTLSFSAPITFTPASGFQTWTKTGGNVTVTPTVP